MSPPHTTERMTGETDRVHVATVRAADTRQTSRRTGTRDRRASRASLRTLQRNHVDLRTEHSMHERQQMVVVREKQHLCSRRQIA
jgi:hypothetical protein